MENRDALKDFERVTIEQARRMQSKDEFQIVLGSRPNAPLPNAQTESYSVPLFESHSRVYYMIQSVSHPRDSIRNVVSGYAWLHGLPCLFWFRKK